MGKDSHCVVCGGKLRGRQRRFCGVKCKNADTNNRNQNYVRQQERGLARKLTLIGEAGGACTRCGYDRNVAALTWHHVDPATKSFHLDIRSLSNRNERAIRRELAKCILVCANCHADVHFPSLRLEGIARQAKSLKGLGLLPLTD